MSFTSYEDGSGSMLYRQDDIVNRRAHSQVLTFLEEAQMYGIAYAERRALQRLAMGLLNPGELSMAATDIERRVERKYSFFHWWYLVVIGLGVAALPLYLVAIFWGRFPATFRMVLCIIVPAIIIFIRVYAGYLREIDERCRRYRTHMAALYRLLGKQT